MLPKKFRLKAVEFYKNPQRAAKFISPFFIFRSKISEGKTPRFCVSVPKLLDKRSSYRHKTKRIIIEELRKKITNINLSVDAMIKMKKIVDKKNRNMVGKEINRYFYEISLLK